MHKHAHERIIGNVLAGLSDFTTLVAERFGIGEVETDAVFFRSSIQSWRLGTSAVMQVQANTALTLIRTQPHIDQAHHHFFTVGLLERGEATLSQEGRTTRLGPNQLVLCDSRSPFSLEFGGEFCQRLFIVPCEALEAHWLNPRLRTAWAVDSRSGLASLSASMLRVLEESQMTQSRCDGPLVEAQLVEQFSRVFGREELAEDQPDMNSGALQRVRRMIEENLANQHLSPDIIATRLGCSRRYLYKLFESSGEGVASFIRRRRVERARELLENEATARLSLGEVAHLVGFTNATSLARNFRELVGTPPIEYRKKRFS